MSYEVRVPALGETVGDAVVGAWLRKPGDRVAAGEPLVELETEEVNVEVTAERAGVLERIVRVAGTTVQPGDLLAVLAEAAPGAVVAVYGPATRFEPPGDTDTRPARPARRSIHVSPEARRLAETRGVDLDQIVGTGPSGRIMVADVVTFLRVGQRRTRPNARYPDRPLAC
jgi:2-oxoglutarate dehydrogenase E2 component (dihydrolipoamide succinyltransferase)